MLGVWGDIGGGLVGGAGLRALRGQLVCRGPWLKFCSPWVFSGRGPLAKRPLRAGTAGAPRGACWPALAGKAACNPSQELFWSLFCSVLRPSKNPSRRRTCPPAPQSALAKERRELREQQQRTLLEAIPKDLSR